MQYGTASSYQTVDAKPGGGGGIYIHASETNELLFGIGPPTFSLVLPGGAAYTLVMVGYSEPKGNSPFLSFSLLNEHFKDQEDNLYGGLPIRINFAAMRFANLITTEGTTLDVSFYEPTGEFAVNDNFRRNLPGQGQILNVAPLGLFAAIGTQPMKPYFLLSTLFNKNYPYRIERHTAPSSDWLAHQATLVPDDASDPEARIDFPVVSNARYTIVAYGPATTSEAKTVILRDNTPAPPPGNARIRFFHGAFGDWNQVTGLQEKKLKLRIGSNEGNLAAYGEVPDGSNSFSTSAGTVQIALLDEQNTVITTFNDIELEANEAYTLFLSRGSFGNALLLTPSSEKLVTR